FSSRRRHTRSYGDWSSDVCSSDLEPPRFGCEFVGRSPFGVGATLARYRDPAGNEGAVEGALLVGADGPGSSVRGALAIACRYLRSEERRVGKECRCGWARAV